MHGLRRRLSEPRMAGHLPADRSANQRVTSAGDSFLCILMCGTQHTYVQSKKQAKIAPVENSKRAGSTGLSWDLRQKLAKVGIKVPTSTITAFLVGWNEHAGSRANGSGTSPQSSPQNSSQTSNQSSSQT